VYALVFPGQGSQSLGMGKEIAEAFAPARKIYEEADDILGYRLSALCFEGGEEELRQTVHAQPALFVTSVATWYALNETVEVNPVCVAGHSVGEYAALVAAFVLEWRDGLRLVRARAEAMQEAAERSPGTMAAVLGLDADAVESACAEASSAGVVCVANRNCPGQVVISGEAEAVAKAGELCKAKGAKRVIPLRVSGAFHSPLMQPAAERFRVDTATGDLPPAEGSGGCQPYRRRAECRDRLRGIADRTVAAFGALGGERAPDVGSRSKAVCGAGSRRCAERSGQANDCRSANMHGAQR
jgi:[acyl-carrier-protein] S-malonyltransferase